MVLKMESCRFRFIFVPLFLLLFSSFPVLLLCLQVLFCIASCIPNNEIQNFNFISIKLDYFTVPHISIGVIHAQMYEYFSNNQFTSINNFANHPLQRSCFSIWSHVLKYPNKSNQKFITNFYSIPHQKNFRFLILYSKFIAINSYTII